LDLIQSIAVSVISAIFLGVPLALFEFLLKHSNRYFQSIGVTLTLLFLALDLYISLANAALMGLDSSNVWAEAYFSSFLLSTFMTVILIIILFI
jgi:hypothetical protein